MVTHNRKVIRYLKISKSKVCRHIDLFCSRKVNFGENTQCMIGSIVGSKKTKANTKLPQLYPTQEKDFQWGGSEWVRNATNLSVLVTLWYMLDKCLKNAKHLQ